MSLLFGIAVKLLAHKKLRIWQECLLITELDTFDNVRLHNASQKSQTPRSQPVTPVWGRLGEQQQLDSS